jgi:hypothetical protein
MVLRDPALFRYSAPDDVEQLLSVVAETVAWQPVVVLLDSIGELLPMFGASSNSPDDFTRVHTTALKPLADSGAAVIAIDHLAKNTESQSYGSTGTAAKKRVVGGTSLRVAVIEPFKPGYGGKAQLTINKDRHGGLRAASPSEDREPLAATFQLFNSEGDIRWTITAPAAGERPAVADVPSGDLRELSELDPPPTSQRDVKTRTGWGSTRALRALQEWRRQGSPTVLPRSHSLVSGAEEHSPTDAPRSAPGSTGSVSGEVSGIASGTGLDPVLPAPHTGEWERGSVKPSLPQGWTADDESRYSWLLTNNPSAAAEYLSERTLDAKSEAGSGGAPDPSHSHARPCDRCGLDLLQEQQESGATMHDLCARLAAIA